MTVAQATALLGVRQDADDKALHAAYKEHARMAHPDAGGSVEAFDNLGAAYEVLQKHHHQQRWGTSASAYGSHAQPALKAIENKQR